MPLQKQGFSRILLLPLAVNIALIISYVGLWFIAAHEGYLWRADFTAFYTGGAIVRDGLGDQLYNLNLQKQYQQEILGEQSFSQGVLPFISPPHFALLIAPITLLSLSQAYIVWTLMQLVILICFVFQLKYFARSWHPIERWLLIITCLALPGLMRSFLLGALSLILTLCLWKWYLSLTEDNYRRAGIWLLIGSIKPQLILPPVLASIFGRQWKIIAIFTMGGLILIGSTMVLFGWRIWFDYLRLLATITSSFDELGVNPVLFYNLKGTLTLWLGNGHSSWINFVSICGFILSVLIIAWLWLRQRDTDKPILILKVVLTLSLGIFFSLHFNQHDGLLLAVPGILLYQYLRIRGYPRSLYAVLGLTCPVAFLLDEFLFSNFLPVRLAVIATIVIIIWAGIYLLYENHVIPLRLARHS